ncbi:MAG: Gfo/Idh/MocA family oxidoreductase [Verrucomicrobiaceae bacterium]|nr:Gfo/Idh/MocA family oxidoreductase [Verrucomicrobiaceae bacterium]
MNVAVVGAGAWGKNLVSTLTKLGSLGPVAEASQGLRDKLAETYPGIELRPDYAGVLNDPAVTAVAVATPAHTHHAIAKALLEAGKDVFVEKPMTLVASESEDLVATAAKHGRILMVGHLLMYQPAIHKIKELIGQGAIGKVFTIHQQRSKLGRARAVENVLWSFGVHDVAVLLDLVGEKPCDVQVSGHCGLQAGIEDDVYLHLTFPGGVKAHLHNSWLWPDVARWLIVIGSEGMLVYSETGQKVTLHRKKIDAALANVDQGEEVVFNGSGEPLILEMKHFMECCQTRATPRSDGENGLSVVRVLEQAEMLFRPAS